MKIIFHTLIVLLLVSCAKNAPQIVTTSQSLATPTVNLGVTATKPFPSKTASPSKSPTNTPIALLATYTLPVWMSNPDTNILAALVTNDFEHTRKISFFNATTGENYEILMPRDVSGYFWYDNTNFGLLSKNLETAYRINLQTGKVSTESVSSQATHFLRGEEDDYKNSYGDTASALKITKDADTNNLLFTHTWYGHYGGRSKNGLSSAEWDGNWTQIIVTDNKTNQTIWQSEPFQDTYGTSFMWSPKDESHLAYLKGKPAEPLSDFITESITLTIVDVVNGKVLGNYAGDFGTMKWSPDGKKILYEDPMSHYHTYGIEFKDAPCILFLNLGERRCLRSIPRLVPEGYQLVTTGAYEWGPDNQSILYTYIYEKQNNVIGNLCIYSLVTGYINCPIENLEALSGMTIGTPDMSPDQQFIHFCYGTSSLLSGDAGINYEGVINVDGTGFFSWEAEIGGPPRCSFGTLWRPLP
jgi:hypothetical protein